MGTDAGARLDEEGVTYCARHPQVETALRCGRCDTLICPRCLVQTPVGARCRDCANVRRLPTVDVSPIFFLRGLAAAIVSGFVVGAAWGFAVGVRSFGFFAVLIGLGVGWAIAEAIGLATNRKRSYMLQGCAIGAAISAYLVRNAVAGIPLLPQGDTWGFIAMGVAAFYAASRLRA